MADDSVSSDCMLAQAYALRLSLLKLRETPDLADERVSSIRQMTRSHMMSRVSSLRVQIKHTGKRKTQNKMRR